MFAYKFETEVSESGLVSIPREILDKVKNCLVEIVILKNELTEQQGEINLRSLMGKYKGCLSTTDEFSKRKALEKEKDL